MMPSPDRKSRLEVIYPSGKVVRHAPDRWPMSFVTTPGARLYGFVSTRVRGSRLKRRGTGWDGLHVVSVGNLEVGGNGKTPFSVYLIETLCSAGERPVYISRGYGSVAEQLNVVSVVCPNDVSPAPVSDVRFLKPGSRGLSAAVGDEGAMVAGRCPHSPLVFSRDRGRAIEVARDMFHPTHVVLDDAFQTWHVHRDTDIVLLDAENPFGNGRLVPAGSLREEAAALERASWIGFNGCRDDEDLHALSKEVRARVGAGASEVPVFGLRRRLKLCDPVTGDDVPVPGRIASLSGIARPNAFDSALTEMGLDVCVSIRFPDHYDYGPRDMTKIRRALSSHEVDHIVTTEKDWVKLREGSPIERCLVARLELEVLGSDPAVSIRNAAGSARGASKESERMRSGGLSEEAVKAPDRPSTPR